MRNFSKAMFLGLILVVVAAGAAYAQSCSTPGTNANVNYNFHQPITQTLTNVCTNPNTVVTLGGEYFYEYHCEQKANGDFHLHITTHFNVTGTDSNGVKYVGKDSQSSDLKMDPDGTFPPVPTSDFRTSDKFKLIAQGPTPDMTITSTTHMKVDANNNITVNVEKGPAIKCSR